MTLVAHKKQPTLVHLREHYGTLTGLDLLDVMIKEVFPGRIAVESSFGAESVALLHMVAQVDPSTPIIFLSTGKLFPETLRYRDQVRDFLGLQDVRSVQPAPEDQARLDPEGDLWHRDGEACCHFRKVLPLRGALEPFDAVVTGRKRFQTDMRANMPLIEERRDGTRQRFQINPLAQWVLKDLQLYIRAQDLPRHPLLEEGYLSIGCMPCTQKAPDAAHYRAGRWAGQARQECGIHIPTLRDGDGI